MGIFLHLSETPTFCASCDHSVLVAAMNPWACGYYGDPVKGCTCSSATVTKYQKRISGPLLDRIDIHIEVPRVEYEKLSDRRFGEPSAAMSLLKLARTIADLADSEKIQPSHLAEALQYRPRMLADG